jgi:hypothetical protein
MLAAGGGEDLGISLQQKIPSLRHEFAQRHVLAIGPECYQDRKWACVVWKKDVTAQDRAIAHQDCDITINYHAATHCRPHRSPSKFTCVLITTPILA